MSNKPDLKDFQVHLSSPKPVRIIAQGENFHVIKALAPVGLKFNDKPLLTRAQGQGGQVKGGYKELWISSDVAQTVVISLGYGRVYDNSVSVTGMPPVQVEATVAAASTSGNPINIALAAGQSVEVLPANEKRHSASIVRGESDLYNVKLAYGSAVNAQNGIPFSPQATANVESKSSVWAYNHSAVTQHIVAIDTSIL